MLSGPLSGTCRDRALRGGSWDNLPQAVRAGSRSADGSQARQAVFGFRVAKTLPQ